MFSGLNIFALPVMWAGLIYFAVIIAIVIVLRLIILGLVVKEAYNDATDADIDIRWRKRWLIDHFGEGGAARWLLNKKASELYLKNAARQLQALCAQYPWLTGDVARRGEDGFTLGTVVRKWGGQMGHNSWFSPWGMDFEPYSVAHGKDTDHESLQPHGCGNPQMLHHGEPWWYDWLAAGYYDKALEQFVKDNVMLKHRGEGASTVNWHLPDEVKRPLEDKAEAIYRIESRENREKKRKDDIKQALDRIAWEDKCQQERFERIEKAEAEVMAERARAAG